MSAATEHRTRRRDNREIVNQVRCPECGVWGDVDADQLAGRVSCICPECGWHGYFARGAGDPE